MNTYFKSLALAICAVATPLFILGLPPASPVVYLMWFAVAAPTYAFKAWWPSGVLAAFCGYTYYLYLNSPEWYMFPGLYIWFVVPAMVAAYLSLVIESIAEEL